jgi:HPt (histidine-containing phosphotransfer) domain-containing protein
MLNSELMSHFKRDMTLVAPARPKHSCDGQPPSIFLNEPFLELRQMYFNRLQADRIQLVSLAVSLAGAADDAGATLCDIRSVAHRMRGAAAIFEVPLIACAAAALEEAARAAGTRDAHKSDPRVGDALANLVDCVARLAGSNTA